MDISTINIELTKLLINSDLKITVVTNMIEIMLLFTKSSCNINLIFIGGEFDRGKDGFIGSMSASIIKNFKFDLAFLGVVGVDLYDNSVATYVPDDVMTKKTVMENSKKKYMVMETKKFNMDGSCKYSPINSFDGIILEKKPTEDIVSQLKEYDVDLIF